MTGGGVTTGDQTTEVGLGSVVGNATNGRRFVALTKVGCLKRSCINPFLVELCKPWGVHETV